ncbi:MAG: extracellular solute-binding protein [Chloroflexi bacterium]|nr:extracellular solute-binding protein [Chloroflexota bacterium]
MSEKRLTRREVLRSAGIAGAAGLLVACQPAVVEKVVEKTVVVTEEKVVEKVVVEKALVDWPTVRWAARPPGEGYDAIMKLLDEWQTEKKIRVMYEPIPGGWDEIIQKMMAGFAAGDAPEIWRMYGPYVRKCIDFKIAMNLTPFIEKEDFDLSDFVPGQLLASQKEGQQYGVPDYCGIWGMYYNIDILEEAGLPLPDKETWDVDQYTEYSIKLTKRDASGMLEQAGAETSTSLEFGLSTAIWSFGGQVSDEDRVICKMSEPLAMDALKFKAAQKWEHKVTPSPAESSALNLAGGWGIFPSGKSAFHENGAWFLCNGCGNIPAIADKFRYGCLPHWKGPTGKRETFCTTDTWMASPLAEYPDACWEFEKFLCGVEMQTILAQHAHLQPARRSVVHLWADAVKDIALKTNPKLEDLDVSPFVEGYAYAQPMYWWNCHTAVMEVLKPVLDQIYVTNTGTVDELIPNVCQEISTITC